MSTGNHASPSTLHDRQHTKAIDEIHTNNKHENMKTVVRTHVKD